MSDVDAIIAGAQFEIRRLGERHYHLAAILKAIDRFDEVAAAVRSADTRDDMRDVLMSLLDVDEFQAMTVADMQVRSLSGQRRRLLADEHEAVSAGIADMEAVLADPAPLVGTERGEQIAAQGR